MLRKLPVAVAVVTLAIVGGLIPDAAHAELTISRNEGRAKVTFDTFGTGFPGASDEETFGPFGGVAVAELGAFGQLRAAQTGSGLNAVTALSRPSDIPSFAVRAETQFDVTVDTTESRERVVFDFLVNGGELRLFDPRGSFRGLSASVGVTIFTIGASDVSGFLWGWTTTLRDNGGVLASEVTIFADPLGLGQPALSAITVSGGEALVSIAPFSASVDLGEILRGLGADLIYEMSATVSGPGLNLTGGEATLGDPLNLGGDPGSVISFRAGGPGGQVPGPPALILVVLGALAGVAVARRRHRASADEHVSTPGRG
jgi:hypothetical protein